MKQHEQTKQTANPEADIATFKLASTCRSVGTDPDVLSEWNVSMWDLPVPGDHRRVPLLLPDPPLEAVLVKRGRDAPALRVARDAPAAEHLPDRSGHGGCTRCLSLGTWAERV